MKTVESYNFHSNALRYSRMATLFTDILTHEEIDSLLCLPAVVAARNQLNNKQSGSIYFTMELTLAIKSAIGARLGIDLTNIHAVPMRWIKGDTVPHIDTGVSEFDKTYLMYLTDSPGTLVIDGNTYPIIRGSAYMFPEGLPHETVHTGTEPRLLLGPMSEAGFAVGYAGIAGPGGSSIYIRQIGSNYEFSADQLSWSTLYLPTQVTNTDTGAGVLTIEFVTDVSFSTGNGYFVCSSDKIQFGSSSLKGDGSRPIITIDGVSDYPGLVQNGTGFSGGQNNIYVYNLNMQAINGSTLLVGAGWICQTYFGKGATNNYVINCSSDGTLPGGSNGSGGIVGSYAGADTGAFLTIIGCSSSGTIGQLDGGIVGEYAGSSGGSVTCQQCWSAGIIQAFGGGIFGDYAGDGGSAVALNCYTTGAIGNSAGGIFGRFAGNNGQATAENCYSTGSTDTDAGGVYGIGAGSDGGTTTATNCYSAGIITTTGRGIYGTGKVSGTEINCYIANGSWSSIAANANLQGLPNPTVGTVWVATGVDQPYELRAMGYTPYTIANITVTSSLNRTFTSTVAPGNATGAAIVAGSSYVVLQIDGGDVGSYGTITMDGTTGIITTTPTTIPGSYTLYVRSLGSYHITEYQLTVTEESTCCSLHVRDIDNTTRAQVLAGYGILIGRRGAHMSSSDYTAMRRAAAFTQ